MKLFVQGIKAVAAGQYLEVGDKITFLVGPNSAGKSSAIAALNLWNEEARISMRFPDPALLGGFKGLADAALGRRLTWPQSNRVLAGLKDKDVYTNPNASSAVAGISSVGVVWQAASRRAVIHSILRNISAVDSILQDVREYYFAKLEVGEAMMADCMAAAKITYIENDELVLEDVDIGAGQVTVFAMSSGSVDFQEIADKLLFFLRRDNSDGELKSSDKYGWMIDLIEAGAKRGRLIWFGGWLRLALRASYSGKERQKYFNLIDHYESVLRKLRDEIIAKFRAPTIAIFDSVSPERMIPSDSDLYGIVGGDSASSTQVSLLMSSAVERDWPDWVTNDLDLESGSLIDEVNRTLSTHLFSEAGYQLVVNSNLLMSRRNFSDALEAHSDEIDLDVRMFYCETSLLDSNGRRLKFSDVGAGIGFVFPIVVSCYHGHNGLIIQQPELHLHPALQASLADVFIEASSRKKIVCETHSEHLILRVLRRIRQTTTGTLADSALALRSGDVAFNYFEPMIDGGTRIHNIRVSDDGDFVDRWPNGFFAERDEELFGE